MDFLLLRIFTFLLVLLVQNSQGKLNDYSNHVDDEEWMQKNLIRMGSRVVRGPSWQSRYGDQDGGKGKEGIVIDIRLWSERTSDSTLLAVRVKWDATNNLNAYRWSEAIPEMRDIQIIGYRELTEAEITLSQSSGIYTTPKLDVDKAVMTAQALLSIYDETNGNRWRSKFGWSQSPDVYPPELSQLRSKTFVQKPPSRNAARQEASRTHISSVVASDNPPKRTKDVHRPEVSSFTSRTYRIPPLLTELDTSPRSPLAKELEHAIHIRHLNLTKPKEAPSTAPSSALAFAPPPFSTPTSQNAQDISTQHPKAPQASNSSQISPATWIPPCGPPSRITHTYKLRWDGVTCDNVGSVIALDLSYNGLSGPLPIALARLTSLRSLNLANNNLTGPIPSEWCSLASLEFVNLSHNRLSGPLPACFSALSQLRVLILNHNRFIGPVPSSWATLEHLEMLHLHRNEGLDPTLPPALRAQLREDRILLQTPPEQAREESGGTVHDMSTVGKRRADVVWKDPAVFKKERKDESVTSEEVLRQLSERKRRRRD